MVWRCVPILASMVDNGGSAWWVMASSGGISGHRREPGGLRRLCCVHLRARESETEDGVGHRVGQGPVATWLITSDGCAGQLDWEGWGERVKRERKLSNSSCAFFFRLVLSKGMFGEVFFDPKKSFWYQLIIWFWLKKFFKMFG